MADYASVSQYLDRFRADYLDLPGKVIEDCKSVQRDLGLEVVASVHSRPDAGSGPFKGVRKIVTKLSRRGALSPQAYLELGDVVGLTVVVQYPDQRDVFFDALRRRLPTRTRMGEVEKHENKNGYFAHHAICSRRYPASIRVDQGSEFVSRDLDLWAYMKNVVLDFSRPDPARRPDNPFIESFNGEFRTECLNQHWFMSLDDAVRKCETWRRDYNEVRPNSVIGNKPPISLVNRSAAHDPPQPAGNG